MIRDMHQSVWLGIWFPNWSDREPRHTIPSLPLLLTPSRGLIAKQQHPLLKLQVTKEPGLWVQPGSRLHPFYAIGAQSLVSDTNGGLRAPSAGFQVIAAEWCSDTPGATQRGLHELGEWSMGTSCGLTRPGVGVC